MKFGDIVVNHMASDQNPTKKGVFVKRGHRTGGYNPGDYVVLTNMKRKFWEVSDGVHLEVVGTVISTDMNEAVK
jgi:hypothetical protein